MDKSKPVAPNKCLFEKDQVMCLLELISKNKYVTAKETTAKYNKLKNEAWQSIAQELSLIVGSERSSEQIRLKWDNLKKAAKKRNAMGNQTKVDSILDTVDSILRAASGRSDVKPVDREQIFSEEKPNLTRSLKYPKQLDKDQTKCLHDLISKHKCLKLKSTNAKINRLKSEAWETVAQEFTALTGVKRSPEQLRTKWDNMKKAARRRKVMVVDNNLINTFSMQQSPRSDATLDSLSHISECSIASEVSLDVDPLDNADKKRTLSEDVQMARIDKDLAMAAYFQAKTEKIKLESKKLKLEIKQLQQCFRTFSENNSL